MGAATWNGAGTNEEEDDEDDCDREDDDDDDDPFRSISTCVVEKDVDNDGCDIIQQYT